MRTKSSAGNGKKFFLRAQFGRCRNFFVYFSLIFRAKDRSTPWFTTE